MRGLLLIPVLMCVACLPVAVQAHGGGDCFDSVVHAVEQKYNTHGTRVPMMGFVSFLSARATHGGVSKVHVAEFEEFNPQVDGHELEALVEQQLGVGWERMIREISRNGGDQTLIYVHPEGKKMGMFIVDLDGRELNLVEISVNPEHLKDSVDHYTHHDQGGRPDSD